MAKSLQEISQELKIQLDQEIDRVHIAHFYKIYYSFILELVIDLFEKEPELKSKLNVGDCYIRHGIPILYEEILRLRALLNEKNLQVHNSDENDIEPRK